MRWLGVLTILLVSFDARLSFVFAQEVPQPDPFHLESHDPGYKNIDLAIDFIKSMGSTTAATQIAENLANGKYYQGNPWPGDLGYTGPLTGDMVLLGGLVDPGLKSTINSNEIAGFGQLVDLAATLVHENVHSRQQGILGALTMGIYGTRPVDEEPEAWAVEIITLDSWIAKLWSLYKASTTPDETTKNLERLKVVVSKKIDTTGDYGKWSVDKLCWYSSLFHNPYTQLRLDLIQLLNALKGTSINVINVDTILKKTDSDEEIGMVDPAAKSCSAPHSTGLPGYRTPGEFVSYPVSYATDSTSYCTFGEGTRNPGYVNFVDDGGNAFTPSSDDGGQNGTPATPGPQIASRGDPVTPGYDPSGPSGGTPGATVTPTPLNTPRPTTTDNPKTSSTPTPTETPVATTTDTPTPQTTTSDDTPVHITIYIKASEAVLEGGQTGEPIQGQVVKLVMRDKPALPTTTNDRTTADTGFDKPAPQCTTDADGQCKVDVPAEDRPLYAMSQTPRIGGKPVNNFRLAINLMQHTGGIAETTGRSVPSLRGSMTTGKLTTEPVKIGNRTFLRLGFNTPYGATGDLAEQFSKLLGVPVEIDICLVKEPGPPLGSEQPASYEAINQELPHAAINLRFPRTSAAIR
jgi:hypothetical protein